jgi:hypothetical protein
VWELILPVLGFPIGIVAAMTGVGDGVFIVPLLTLVYAFVPASAVGTSLAAITFTAVAAAISYSRQRRIYYKAGLLLAIATAPGAVIGAFLTSVLPAATLGLIFGFFLIIVVSESQWQGSKRQRLLRAESPNLKRLLREGCLRTRRGLRLGWVRFLRWGGFRIVRHWWRSNLGAHYDSSFGYVHAHRGGNIHVNYDSNLNIRCRSTLFPRQYQFRVCTATRCRHCSGRSIWSLRFKKTLRKQSM